VCEVTHYTSITFSVYNTPYILVKSIHIGPINQARASLNTMISCTDDFAVVVVLTVIFVITCCLLLLLLLLLLCSYCYYCCCCCCCCCCFCGCCWFVVVVVVVVVIVVMWQEVLFVCKSRSIPDLLVVLWTLLLYDH